MNLFAYGTLMWPEVLEAVIGRRLEGEKVTLRGFRRLRIKGEHYPAIIAASGNSVSGVLYDGLTPEDFEHLDRFEGEEYQRKRQQIDNTSVQVYVLAENWIHILEETPWVPEQLSVERLASFCSEYKGWTDLVETGATEKRRSEKEKARIP